MNQTSVENDRLVITRDFAYPVETLYKAWTDPTKMAQWLSANARWNEPLIDIESKVGGRHNITMRHSDGDEFFVPGRYLELSPNRRIRFTWGSASDEGGEESVVTVDFEETRGGTRLTLTHEGLVDPEVKDQVLGGWNGCLEVLAAHLSGKRVLGTETVERTGA